MNKGIDFLLFEDLRNKISIAYVSLDEGVVVQALDGPQVHWVSGVAERVEVDELDFAMLRNHMQQKIRSDESGASSDEDGFELMSCCFQDEVLFSVKVILCRKIVGQYILYNNIGSTSMIKESSDISSLTKEYNEPELVFRALMQELF